MYTLVSAYLRAYGRNETWQTVDISGMALKDIFDTYFDGHISLLYDGDYIYLLLQDIKESQKNLPVLPSMNFSTWLSYLGSKTFVTLFDIPTYTTKDVAYSSADQAHFTIHKVSANDPEDTTGSSGPLTTLRLTKEDIDYDLLHTHVLTSVNGFYHINTPYETGLLIPGGGRSHDISQKAEVGLLSFAGIGSLQQIPITDEMITRPSSSVLYTRSVYIELGIDITNKSVMLSLGGYLHINDRSYDIISLNPGVIRINMDKINLVDRVFEMQKYIDVSDFKLSRSIQRPNTISVPELEGETQALRFVKMSQSFVVVVDAVNLHVDMLQVTSTKLPGVYEHMGEPRYPLQSNTKRQMEYFRKNEWGFWTMTVDNNISFNPLYRTTEWKERAIASNVPDEKGFSYAPAFLAKITSTVVTVPIPM